MCSHSRTCLISIPSSSSSHLLYTLLNRAINSSSLLQISKSPFLLYQHPLRFFSPNPLCSPLHSYALLHPMSRPVPPIIQKREIIRVRSQGRAASVDTIYLWLILTVITIDSIIRPYRWWWWWQCFIQYIHTILFNLVSSVHAEI